MTRDEWLARLAAELGVAPPSAEDADALLDLAGAAAHASERQAAPLSCWLIGVAGVSPADALTIVSRLAAE
jgi:hypothetical protein